MKALLCASLVSFTLSSVVAQEPLDLDQFTLDLGPVGNEAADQPTRRISLAEAIDRALAENIDLAIARAEEKVVQGRHLSAKGTLYPALEASLGARRLDGRVQGSFGALRDVDFSSYIAGTALVYRANIVARLKEAFAERQNLDAAHLESMDSERRLLFRVVELYQDLLLATVAVQISGEVVAGSEQFLKLVKARTKGGLGLGADVARAEAKLAVHRQQLVQARRLLVDTSTRLAVVLRLDVDILLSPADERLAPAHYYSPPDSASDDGTAARPDVQAARKRATAAQQLTSASRWDLYAPEFQAEIGFLEIGDTTSDLNGRSERRVLALWSFSPFAFGQLRQRRAEERLARLRLTGTEDSAAAEIRRTEADLAAAQERIPLAGKGLRAAVDTLRLSEARFKAGTAIALEVLDAQDGLAEARFNLAHAIVQHNAAQARLLAATATIERASFSPPEPPESADRRKKLHSGHSLE